MRSLHCRTQIGWGGSGNPTLEFFSPPVGQIVSFTLTRCGRGFVILSGDAHIFAHDVQTLHVAASMSVSHEHT